MRRDARSMPLFSRGLRGRRVDLDPARHVDVPQTAEDGYQAQRSYVGEHSMQEGAR
jgi:hypothetical protein